MARKSKWTIELATNKAKEFTTKTEFEKKYSGAVKFLKKNNLYNSATSHMRKQFRWTIELVTKESLKYKNRSEFEKENKKAYSWIHKNLSKEEKRNIFKHMEIKREDWNLNRISKLAKKHNTLKEFREKEYAAYHWTKVHLNQKDRDELYFHMKKVEVWTIEKIKRIVTNYQNIEEFKQENYNAYVWTRRNLSKIEADKLYNKFKFKRIVFMNKENAIKKSKEYSIFSKFRKESPTAYEYLKKHSTKEELEIIYSHLEKTYRITEKEIIEISKKYKKKKDFEINEASKYQWMLKNLSRKRMYKICSHMEIGNRGYKRDEPGTLYYLKIQRENYPTVYKVGITNYTVKRRFGSDMKYITIIKEERFENGSEAAEKELNILRTHKKNKYLGKPILQSGNSELFVCDVLGLDF